MVSTYQAVSGSGLGREGVEALENGRDDVYPRPISGNAIPMIGGVGEDGYTTEERKMRLESRKILGMPDLEVFATAVRIPVHTGHSESIYLETEREATLPEVLEALREAPGVKLSKPRRTSRRRSRPPVTPTLSWDGCASKGTPSPSGASLTTC